jgi:hypothetical protein
MEQGRIQRWIERIVRHVKKVNDLQGDNCYREGSTEEPIENRKARRQEKARRNHWNSENHRNRRLIEALLVMLEARVLYRRCPSTTHHFRGLGGRPDFVRTGSFP